MPIHRLLADGVLVMHATFIAFVVVGLALILLGLARRWRGVRNVWFRLTHLAAIVIVAAFAWAAEPCPLTTLENHLRASAGQDAYDTGFIAHWLHRAIFYDAEPWVFVVGDTLFLAAVVGTFVFGRPRWKGK